MVYSSNPRYFPRTKKHKEYLEIVNSSSADELSSRLTEFCKHNRKKKNIKNTKNKYGE